MVDISIIIVNYNTEQDTFNCIESIFQYSKGFAYEVILVDNASEKFDPKKFDCFSNLKVIQNQANLGFSKANNIGIKEAKGQFILLLNSDTILQANTVLEVLNYFKEDADDQIGIVGASLVNEDGSFQRSYFDFPSIKQEAILAFRLHKVFPGLRLSQTESVSKAQEVDWVTGAFMCFDRKLLEEFPEGKLHETFFLYIEDIEWCYYVRKELLKKNIYLKTASIIHLGGQSLKTELLEKRLRFYYPHLKLFLSRVHSGIYSSFFFLMVLLRYSSLIFKNERRKTWFQLTKLI